MAEPIRFTSYQSDVFLEAPKKNRIILMPCGRRVGKTAGGLLAAFKYILGGNRTRTLDLDQLRQHLQAPEQISAAHSLQVP